MMPEERDAELRQHAAWVAAEPEEYRLFKEQVGRRGFSQVTGWLTAIAFENAHEYSERSPYSARDWTRVARRLEGAIAAVYLMDYGTFSGAPGYPSRWLWVRKRLSEQPGVLFFLFWVLLFVLALVGGPVDFLGRG